MKLFYVVALVSALAVTVKAECECDVDDVECLQSCVRQGNACVSQCEDSDCFASCVDDHWPGPDLTYPEGMMPSLSETPSYASMTKDPQMQATPSSWESNMASQSNGIASQSNGMASQSNGMASQSNWNPSSTWSSVPTWTNSVSGSLRPSASGSSPVSSSTNDGQKMSTNGIVSILGLGLAFYNLYLN